ncbi:MAG: glycosyltransferase family 2 protein [Acidiferrobacterales bacterium]|nr:glycosyltransferase family 2 protein [Acidiferrobacterales bacterium]
MTNRSVSPLLPTIIIPAFNEAATIKTTLTTLMASYNPAKFQVVVVCNGCTDNTESIVREVFDNVHCYAIDQASKAQAIRHAEALDLGFPRLYLDADIELSTQGAEQLFEVASAFANGVLIIPHSQLIHKHNSRLVKGFYRHWYQTTFVRDLGYGAGTYLMNKMGRERFGLWPELIADDAFVRKQFADDDTHIATSVNVRVKSPKALWPLIKIKTRSKLGNLELQAYLNQAPNFNVSKRNKTPSRASSSKEQNNAQWYDQLVYLGVNAIALVMAKLQFFRGHKTWQRDNSNH